MIDNRIYYIEDDESIGRDVSAYLEARGFAVSVIDNISDAKAKLEEEVPVLCLIDWTLPDGTGRELCLWIRKRWKELPLIFVTVKDQVDDIVDGFDSGADDYIAKPFALAILHSRILAVLRRAHLAEGMLSCGSIEMNTDKYKVWVHHVEVQLSAMEYQLLELLLRNKNRTVTRESILEKLWDTNENYVNDNTLTVTVKRLRGKLGHPEMIKTIRSFGYRLEES